MHVAWCDVVWCASHRIPSQSLNKPFDYANAVTSGKQACDPRMSPV